MEGLSAKEKIDLGDGYFAFIEGLAFEEGNQIFEDLELQVGEDFYLALTLANDSESEELKFIPFYLVSDDGEKSYLLREPRFQVDPGDSDKLFVPFTFPPFAGTWYLLVADHRDPVGAIVANEAPAKPIGRYLDALPQGVRPPPIESHPKGTPLGDGIENLLRYALSLPWGPDGVSALPEANKVEENGKTYLAMEFPVNESAVGATVEVQFSSDLDWENALSSLEDPDIEVSYPSTGTMIVRDAVPTATENRRFARVLVHENFVDVEDGQLLGIVEETLLTAGLEIDRGLTHDLAWEVEELNLRNSGVGSLQGLGDFYNLETLDLGNLGLEDWSDLAEAPFLRQVIADGNDFSGIPAFQENLEVLVLSGSDQLSDLTPAMGLSDLTELEISGTNVSDLAVVETLPALEILGAASTPVVDLSPLEDHSSLEVLNLANTQVDDLSALSGMTTLRVVDLTDVQTLEAEPGNFFPLQPLLVVDEEVYLEGTTGLNWNDYNETWQFVDQLTRAGATVEHPEADGPIESVTVLVTDEDDDHTAPGSMEVRWFFQGEGESQITMAGSSVAFSEVDLGAAFILEVGNGWRITPTIQVPTPESEWELFGEYDRFISLPDRPVAPVQFFLEKSQNYIEGYIVDEAGEPLASAFDSVEVQITKLGGAESWTVNTDFDGYFKQDFDDSFTVIIEPVVDGVVYPTFEFGNAIDLGTIGPLPFDEDERIVFADGGNLYTIRPDGEEREQLISNGTNPRFVPEGDAVVFNRDQSVRRVFLADGSSTELVASDDLSIDNASGEALFFFSGVSQGPGNGEILFSADPEVLSSPQLQFRNQIWEVPHSGTAGSIELEDLLYANTAQTQFYPVHSPDGTELLFEGRRNTSDFDESQTPAPGVYLIELSGDPEFDEDDLLVADGREPDWSPDGTQFVYQDGSGSGNSGKIYVRDIAATGSGTELSQAHDEARFPSWSPDGDWIVYESGGDLYRIRSDNSESPVLITSGEQPHWGPLP
ncbi:MAG: hypothetical protein LAT55_10990 [Opitutales bacterium]|nr:hypothetical protein [Opitutales bacterium]